MPSTNSPLTPLEAASAAMRRNVMGEIAETEPVSDATQGVLGDNATQGDLSDSAANTSTSADQPITAATTTHSNEHPVFCTDCTEDRIRRDTHPESQPTTQAQQATAPSPQPANATTPPNADLRDFIEVSGLLEYDPAAISRIYAGAPQRLIRRVWQTLVPIGLYLLSVGIDWLTRRLTNHDHARARAKEAADLVASLGPAFIKAGQALSTRPDIVPPLLLEELAGLQDQLPGFDSAMAMACIEEDLGAPIASIYDELEREPISAASLGQVHRGVLLNGEKVAVKVQRPGLREQITLDLYIVRNIAAWLNRNIGLILSLIHI